MATDICLIKKLEATNVAESYMNLRIYLLKSVFWDVFLLKRAEMWLPAMVHKFLKASSWLQCGKPLGD